MYITCLLHMTMPNVTTFISLYTRLWHTWQLNVPYLRRIFRNSLHMVFLFHSWHVQNYWVWDILHIKLILLLGNSIVAMQTFYTMWHLCHICWKGLFNECDTWLVSIFEYIMTGATCGAGNAHSPVNTWFNFLRAIMISHIHYRMCQC